MADTTWFDLKGDARLGRCATESCGGQPTLRMEGGGVGANYCSGCAEKIRTMTDTSKATIAAVVERLRTQAASLENDLIGGEGLQLVESNTMREAASLISAIEAERDTWKDLALKKEAFILSKAQDIEAAEARAAALVYDLNAALRTAETAEALNATLQAKLEKAAKALEPFAQGGAAVTHAFGEALFPDNSMAFPTGCTWSEDGQQCVITWADFRRARSTLREAGNDHT